MPNLRFKFWMDSNFTYIFVFFQVPFLAFWWLGRSVDWWPFANSQRETCLPPLYRSNGILGCPSRKGLCKVRNYLFFFNTQYVTNSTLVYPVNIEYVTKNNIFGLKMMVKSGIAKIFLKFLPAHTMSFLFLILHFSSDLLFSMR